MCLPSSTGFYFRLYLDVNVKFLVQKKFGHASDVYYNMAPVLR